MAYDAKKIYYRFDDHLSRLVLDYEASRQISPESESLYHGLPTDPYDEGLFVEHNVKRGLRNADGSGVVAGLTRISDVHGYNKVDGKVVPDQGKLTLRGYSIEDLVNNAQAENRYGYEEVAYLLITGSLPNKEELDGFCERLGAFRHLSDEYVKEFPMTTVSSSIMNVLQRAVLLLYAFDAEPDVITPEHEIDVAISMLARLPRIAAFAHMASVAKLRGSEVHVPHPTPGLSTAETILQVLRGGMAFTRDEAMLLDVMLMLHAEHGGGNNSTFACRVLSSSATDPYSAYAAAIGSLKGPRHGGANAKVVSMHEDIRAHVSNWEDEDEVAAYLGKILDKQAFDGTGLIYGMGHAVYTLSDPRAEVCRRYARSLAAKKDLGEEFALIERIERLAPSHARPRHDQAHLCQHRPVHGLYLQRCSACPRRSLRRYSPSPAWQAGRRTAWKSSSARTASSAPPTARLSSRWSTSRSPTARTRTDIELERGQGITALGHAFYASRKGCNE